MFFSLSILKYQLVPPCLNELNWQDRSRYHYQKIYLCPGEFLKQVLHHLFLNSFLVEKQQQNIMRLIDLTSHPTGELANHNAAL